ncbi:MAG TPA: YggS family pyridoxal phosphate-dependent enzyme [Terriglobales bacterium]|nr:YggS family pyridoxal phosphate-dependent enzyme [Terriglobales bacterium]
MSIAENLEQIRGRIAAAARRCGRSPDQIALMAVSKTFPASAIREAYAAGQRLFGENRVQEFAAKAGEVGDLEGAEFHLIGHLQSNKSAWAVELFDAVDALDSIRLAKRLDAATAELVDPLPRELRWLSAGALPGAARVRRPYPVLVEVNIAGEEQKSGMAPDSPELLQLLEAAPSLPAIAIRGLMTVPPFTDDPEGARPHFHALRELRERLAARFPGVPLRELSMGMSHDFEVAIAEGSTCVRIGSAIFGARERH